MIKLDEIINTREKKILAYSVGLIVLVIFIQFIILPAYHYKNQLKSQVRNQTQLIQWMLASKQTLETQAANHSPQKINLQGSFFTILEDNLQSISVKPERMEQQGNSILLEFDHINAQTLFTLLVQLDNAYPFEIQRAEITRLADDGFVKAILVVRNMA